MAAPPDVTLENLNGIWTLDKSMSSDTNPVLALQGVNWVIRKAVAIATVTLDITEYQEPNPGTLKPVVRIEIVQSNSSGLPGTTEKRVLDWSENLQEDHLFGKCIAQTRLIRGIKQEDGNIVPNIDIQTQIEDEAIAKFLRGEILDQDRTSEGFLVEAPREDDAGEGEGLWVQLFVRNQVNGWTAEQVWGFETIENERRFVRRLVVAKEGKYQVARIVYKFVGKKE
ncbi:hypothetical protein V500_11552 [Pseudogymnoascus sp. VKM F-4518 (FW-2643)]|nr:hypothetical protein V500_11552 [Pseudogymnoascus sp. VKM F-4518 (FW-2643)]